MHQVIDDFVRHLVQRLRYRSDFDMEEFREKFLGGKDAEAESSERGTQESIIQEEEAQKEMHTDGRGRSGEGRQKDEKPKRKC